jgi:predicted P-loop ATPase
MIGVVARVMQPGCKRDDVLALLGKQGHRKSSLAKAISDAIIPGSFVETPSDLGNDEAKRRLQGCVIAELSEMESLRKNEVTAVKRYLSATVNFRRNGAGDFRRNGATTTSEIRGSNAP